VARKHRLAERLLADVIGLDWSLVHDEACRWEHVMSDEVERKLLDMLGHPTESPYGNPIPGLELIGGKKAAPFLEGVVRLTDVASDEESTGLLRRIGEPAQFDPEMLKTLARLKIIPGARIRARRLDATSVRVESLETEKPLTLPNEIAAHLYLAA
jgi:DtxR family Mn-dependent transcriptional regulator